MEDRLPEYLNLQLEAANELTTDDRLGWCATSDRLTELATDSKIKIYHISVSRTAFLMTFSKDGRISGTVASNTASVLGITSINEGTNSETIRVILWSR